MMLQTGDKGALGKDDTEKVGQCWLYAVFCMLQMYEIPGTAQVSVICQCWL
jgi:hypothetical protein